MCTPRNYPYLLVEKCFGCEALVSCGENSPELFAVLLTHCVCLRVSVCLDRAAVVAYIH